jgi:hypothetical protein
MPLASPSDATSVANTQVEQPTERVSELATRVDASVETRLRPVPHATEVIEEPKKANQRASNATFLVVVVAAGALAILVTLLLARIFW